MFFINILCFVGSTKPVKLTLANILIKYPEYYISYLNLAQILLSVQNTKQIKVEKYHSRM